MKKKVLKNLFAIFILVVLVYLVDVEQLWGALSQLTVEAVLYLGLLSVALIFVSALKWKFFLDAFGKAASVVRLFNLYLVGYFVNLLVPSYVGGDIARSWYIGKEVGQHNAFSATILERYTGFVAMLTLALFFMWHVELVTVEIKLAVLLISSGLVVITFLALSEKALLWCGRIKKLQPILVHIKKIQEGFHLVRKDRKLLVKTLALSFVFHSLTVVNTVAAAYAVGWYDPPLWELFVVLPLILLIGAIPVAPAGLGIQEGAFLFFLTGIGATPAQALGVGIVLRAKLYVLAIIGGFVWLGVKKDGTQKS
ncbi:flippase-like domain-containing protein [Oligoflexia bacterium]|nr:flippase-like domain-containing protein [Oligoflexia bacterium]